MSNCGNNLIQNLLRQTLNSSWRPSGNASDGCDTSNTSDDINLTDLYPTEGEHDDPFAIDYGLDFYAYLTPIIIIVGLFGNTVSLYIFKRSSIRKLSASAYLSAISVSDTCVLVFIWLDWLNKGMPRIGGSGVRAPLIKQHVFCQTFLFGSYTFRFISVWLIIVFTCERYNAICRPFHRGLICTKTFSHKLIGCVALVAPFLCLYKPIISGVVEMGGNIVCSSIPEYKHLNFILDSFYGVLITALPFLIITLLNVFILKKLVCSGTEKDLKIVSTKESKMRLEFTFILLSISTSFVCLNIPYFIIWCQRFSNQNEATSPNGGNNSSLEHMVLFMSAPRKNQPRNELWITRSIFFINYAINFFLYYLTGKQYRKYMRQLLCCEANDRIDRNGSSFRSGYTSQSFVFSNSQKSINGSQKSHNSSLKSSGSTGRMSRHGSSSCNRLVYSSSGSSLNTSKYSFSTKV